MDRKPENGCEIQNAACIDSNIMIQLKLVKSKEDEERLESRRSDKDANIEVDNQNEGRFWKQHGWIKEEGAGEMQGQMWKREYSRLQQVYTPDGSNPAAVLVL